MKDYSHFLAFLKTEDLLISPGKKSSMCLKRLRRLEISPISSNWENVQLSKISKIWVLLCFGIFGHFSALSDQIHLLLLALGPFLQQYLCHEEASIIDSSDTEVPVSFLLTLIFIPASSNLHPHFHHNQQWSSSHKGCRPKKTTVYLQTLSKLRLTPLPPTLFLTNLFLTKCGSCWPPSLPWNFWQKS